MTERERLIELIGSKVCEDYSPNCDEWQPHSCEKCYANDCRIGELADYLIAKGVIVPPCKVGDSCYPLPRYKTPIVERKISRITYSKRNIIIGYYENDGQWRPPLRTRTLGEDIFLTKQEAEQALEALSK